MVFGICCLMRCCWDDSTNEPGRSTLVPVLESVTHVAGLKCYPCPLEHGVDGDARFVLNRLILNYMMKLSVLSCGES